MKAEKKEKMRAKAQGKQIGETVKTINIINLVIIIGGFFLTLLNYSPLLTKIGQGLVFAGSFLILLTIIFQIMAANKLRK
ncbi:MAG: hypothetical protein RBQ94_01900 [Methanimicrococcus sp.]|nr:hypothetical protein [Methanimicrococcus sp.]